jgi:peptidoglycan/xylan/chitin deacetylase (PgdA/CDA1 family)
MRAIVTYHSIDPSGSVISTGVETFRQHLRCFAAMGVEVATLENLLRLPVGRSAVALTFDDGFANFAEFAWPVLREYGMPATLFVATDFVGTENRWDHGSGSAIPRLPLLGWDQIARPAEEGLEIGSHTRTHPDLRALHGPALDDELQGSADRIRAETGRTPSVLAYPYGLEDDGAVEAARRAYRAACTTELRQVSDRDDRLRLPRLDAYYLRSASLLSSWGTRRFRGHLWLRAGARRVRQTIRPIQL